MQEIRNDQILRHCISEVFYEQHYDHAGACNLLLSCSSLKSIDGVAHPLQTCELSDAHAEMLLEETGSWMCRHSPQFWSWKWCDSKRRLQRILYR